MPKRSIYLDHHSTTPCDPRVVDAMLPFYASQFANPSSTLHALGREAADVVDRCRESIAAVFGVQPRELVFTGSATESNNLALLGLAKQARAPRREIITTTIEHKSILETCAQLSGMGLMVTVLPVSSDGRLNPSELLKVISERTLLVSIQTANNEIGTLQEVPAIAEITHSAGALLHTDAAQAIGRIPFDLFDCGADLVSASAHKLYGPKGIGLLYLRGGVRKLPISPIQFGGGQEFGLRPGTSNVPAIVGFAKAIELLEMDRERDISRVRDQFESAILAGVPGVRRNGRLTDRLPGNSSLTFPGIDAEALLANVPELALSTGSACTSGAPDPSHVLTAVGLSRADALSTVRVGLGRNTTSDDAAYAAALIIKAVERLQSLSARPVTSHTR